MERETEPRILCVGDCLPCGTFRVHSRFARIINLSHEGNLISVALSEKERAPSTITVDGCDLGEVDEVEISSDKIRIAQHTFSRSTLPLFDSHASGSVGSVADLESAVQTIRRDLLPSSPEQSLRSLLLPQVQCAGESSFETRLLALLREGAMAFASGNFAQGACLMRGCGFGLTPSGDDFICGFLAGLATLEALGGRITKPTRQELLDVSLGTNSLSNHFLRLAAEGKMFESLRNFSCCALQGNNSEMVHWGQQLLRVGETSGADMLVGFTFFLEREITQCQFR